MIDKQKLGEVIRFGIVGVLPTTFPIVIPAFCCIAAVILTAASGILVPIATMVSPIISWGIPNFLAMLADPSTNQSAPFTRKRKPTIKIPACNIKRQQSPENGFSFFCPEKNP